VGRVFSVLSLALLSSPGPWQAAPRALLGNTVNAGSRHSTETEVSSKLVLRELTRTVIGKFSMSSLQETAIEGSELEKI
jgi:hypothetical protein